ncbi:MAG: flagellar biosynthesis protein FliQ [Syntrophomonadaceae bacterium]|jgi:flagellar biosynthetic protein FliQ
MFEDIVLNIANQAVLTTLIVSAPLLGITLVVGLLISILQATTQIQEMTLVFVPKIIVALLVLVVMGPWMLNILTSFTYELYSSIPQLVSL